MDISIAGFTILISSNHEQRHIKIAFQFDVTFSLLPEFILPLPRLTSYDVSAVFQAEIFCKMIQCGAVTCFKGFVKSFLRIPQVVGIVQILQPPCKQEELWENILQNLQNKLPLKSVWSDMTWYDLWCDAHIFRAGPPTTRVAWESASRAWRWRTRVSTRSSSSSPDTSPRCSPGSTGCAPRRSSRTSHSRPRTGPSTWVTEKWLLSLL